ncbi:MAG TPA: prepilin-type N-terminal cleavage/methylation domain-containing protein [Candidatus Saccharimonadales bacterium]
MKQLARGFSIVELIVVIVILGVVATFTVINISGSQINGRNASRIQTAQQLHDSARILVNDLGISGVKALLNGSAPNYQLTCLGKSYTDINADGKGDCMKTGTTPLASESSTLLTAITKVSNPPLAKDMPSVTSGTSVFYGPGIFSPNVDGAPVLVMEYKLEKEQQNCKLSPLIYFTSGAHTRTGTQNYSASAAGSNMTTCIVSIQD